MRGTRAGELKAARRGLFEGRLPVEEKKGTLRQETRKKKSLRFLLGLRPADESVFAAPLSLSEPSPCALEKGFPPRARECGSG